MVNLESRNEFLRLIDSARGRGIAGGLFLKFGPRSGETDPARIVQNVCDACRIRTETATDTSERLVYESLARVLSEHPDEALRMAAYACEYENLTPQQRQALKNNRASAHVARWMEQRPPTPKQINMLRSLGYRGAVASRQEASEVIASRLRVRGGAR